MSPLPAGDRKRTALPPASSGRTRMLNTIGTGSTLWKGQTLHLPWGELFHEGTSLTLRTASQDMSRTINPDLCPFLEVHWTSTYFVAAPAAGEELYLGTSGRQDIEQIATIARWRDSQVFSPGVHTVRFFDLDEHSCAVATEIGIAMVTAEQALIWQVTHGDTSNRVLSVDAEHIKLMGLYAVTWFSTVDGTSEERPVKKTS